MLDDLGLAAALQQLTRELSEQAGIEIGFTQIAHTHAALLPDAVNTVVFRIAQEALTNIVRHAQASRASVSLDVSSNAVTLSIADNGRGFDVERALADLRAGVGLRNMRERVDSLGGSLTAGVATGSHECDGTCAGRSASVHQSGYFAGKLTMNDVPSSAARLILVDDHPLVRDGLRARLEAVPNLAVVGEAGDADEALALAAELNPDLAR